MLDTKDVAGLGKELEGLALTLILEEVFPGFNVMGPSTLLNTTNKIWIPAGTNETAKKLRALLAEIGIEATIEHDPAYLSGPFSFLSSDPAESSSGEVFIEPGQLDGKGPMLENIREKIKQLRS